MNINHVVLTNHFGCKDTTVVGDIVNNGCQTFHIDKLEDVCTKFKVSDKQKQQIIDAHNSINSSDFTNLFNTDIPSIIECLLYQGVYSDEMIVGKFKPNNGLFINQIIIRNLERIRVIIARYGHNLDLFACDESGDVRYQVATQGYRLDHFINDPCIFIRSDVARQGYGLDKLMHDPTLSVQFEVVKQGYRLDHFINSEFITLRLEIARQGYGLDMLINDPCSFVRHEAQSFIKSNEL